MKKLVKKRKVDYLWHFTKLENLPSILQDGLRTRADLEKNDSKIDINDEERLDKKKDSISCSIAFPNYKLYWSYHNHINNIKQRWVFLAIDPSILWEKDCLFYPKNAANGDVNKISRKKLKGKKALKAMFKKGQLDRSRKKLNIPKKYPTNPQAEVLVLETIEPKFIKIVVCKKLRKTKKRLIVFEDIQKCQNISTFFQNHGYDPSKYREDWRAW